MTYLKQLLCESIAVAVIDANTHEKLHVEESIGKALRYCKIYNKRSNSSLLSKKKNGQRRIMYSDKFKTNIYLQYDNKFR